METLGRSGSWWKTSSFLFSWVVAFTIFHKTDQRLSQLPPSGAGISWDVNKKNLHIWRVLLSSCSNRGVLLSWVFWQGGSVAAGETARAGNFETSNPLTKCQKVDTEGGKSFCSSPKLFQDRTSRYKCRICIGSSALKSFPIKITAQWDMVWRKWGEKIKGLREFLYLLKKGERGGRKTLEHNGLR